MQKEFRHNEFTVIAKLFYTFALHAAAALLHQDCNPGKKFMETLTGTMISQTFSESAQSDNPPFPPHPAYWNRS